MVIQKLQELLDTHKIKYTTISYSPAHTTQELANYKSQQGMDLIEAVLVKIKNEQIVMAVVPANLQINIGSWREFLHTAEVKLLDRKEVAELFPDCEFGTVTPFGNLDEMDVFFASELNQSQEIEFYQNSYNNLIRMKYSDFEKLVSPRKEIVFSTISRYRAVIDSVFPESARQKISNYEHCLLGLSLENQEFFTAKLVAITDWISRHFKKCTVMIGDRLHRITLQIDEGLNEEQALNKALILGREYINREGVVFERHIDTCTFDVVFSSEIQKWDTYAEYYKKIQYLFAEDKKFANSVNSFARKFIERRFSASNEEFNHYIEMSCTYILEELAIFACLAESSLSAMVYPGSLYIFEEIAEGQHPSLPESLQKIIYVALSLKRR
ncbi:hypothetical protein NIES4103_66510 [Nostoc sp. NIES-4103]|nr:hypothetical protein NIES4103_66510 [Nostoc sp. NIES-4103]